MSNLEHLKKIHAAAAAATAGGPPRRTSNPFFGVGPITDGAADEVEARRNRFAFARWFEETYRKLDDKGRDLGPFTLAEVSRSMHRGYPADKIILDMMRAIHRYFGFPKENRLGIGIGGGHAGFTVAALHLLSTDKQQNVFIDTPRPESEEAKRAGFFRQLWGSQLVEIMRLSKHGDETRLHFAGHEGTIPPYTELLEKGVKLVFGVGHETSGATTYKESEIRSLLAFVEADPEQNHVMLDATSLLGAMPWGDALSQEVTRRFCFFMPFQKAIGGISGYHILSFTPQALARVERNAKNPLSPVPRQLKLAVPIDPQMPLTGERTVAVGPFYDGAQDKMLGGVLNTFNNLAFAETTFGVLSAERRVGSVTDMNRRSAENRAAINTWLEGQSFIAAGVPDPERRGAAVTLLKINDPDITNTDLHARIIARSKQLLGYEGLTHPDGTHEPGLDTARYVNAFPGTPGDYRAWIGGIRTSADITALLDNLSYAYLRAKAVVAAEELAKHGVSVQSPAPAPSKPMHLPLQELRTQAEDLAAITAALQTTSLPELRDLQWSKHEQALKKAAKSLAAALVSAGLAT
jgi:phosphoserine aminotransferase